jgi:hypothetical protein
MLVDAETVEVIEVQCPSQKNDDVFWKKAPPPDNKLGPRHLLSLLSRSLSACGGSAGNANPRNDAAFVMAPGHEKQQSIF